MKSRLFLYAALTAVVALAGIAGFANSPQPVSSAPQPGAQDISALLSLLPPSDGIVFVDTRRLLTDVVPRLLAANAGKLAKLNDRLDRLKASTGLDPRSFDRVALGFQFTTGNSGRTHIETIAIAQGSFDAGALRGASNSSSVQGSSQVYRGKEILVFRRAGNRLENHPESKVKPATGSRGPRPFTVAVASLDQKTLAIGNLTLVRAAIDAASGAGRVQDDLVALATREPNAIVSFAGMVPPSLFAQTNLGSDEVARSAATVKRSYGYLVPSASGFGVFTAAVAATAADAKVLADTLNALKPLAGAYASQLPPDSAKLLQNAVNSLKVTTQDNEVQIRFDITASDMAALSRVF